MNLAEVERGLKGRGRVALHEGVGVFVDRTKESNVERHLLMMKSKNKIQRKRKKRDRERYSGGIKVETVQGDVDGLAADACHGTRVK
jgi:hypothetical protein